MKRWSRFVAVMTFLGLTVWGAACGSLLPNPAYPGPETPTPLPTETPLPTPAITPYPPPTVEPTVPVYPTGPRPTDTPTPVPTATPPPTALPLPPSGFNVLWVETTYPGSPSGDHGVIWLADPRDIANRREVVRFDDRTIGGATLSPNGRQVAFTTSCWKCPPSPLWVVNLDGSNLRQIAPIAGRIFWSQDGRAIYYRLGIPEEKADGLVKVDLASREVQRILTVKEPGLYHLLGWSAGGQWFYYTLPPSPTGGQELWRVRYDGSTTEFITSLPEIQVEWDQVRLSPNGTKLLLGTHWISTDGQEEGTVPIPQPGEAYEILWDRGENDVIMGQQDKEYPLFHLYEINLQSQHIRDLATFDIPPSPGWDQLALSPDHHWLMAHVIYRNNYYWVHLPSGTLVPVTCCQGCVLYAVGWVPRGREP